MKTIIKHGDKIALVAMSNGLAPRRIEEVAQLSAYLTELGLQVVLGRYVYETEARPAKARGEELMGFFLEPSIKGIFDISGGDVANETLTELNYAEIASAKTPFFGYSDVTTLLNAIYSQSKQATYLYQVRHLADPTNRAARQRFEASLVHGMQALSQPQWRFAQGEAMSGTVIGGNIRCFLKLAGTPYMPDVQGNILFLESMSGAQDRIKSYFHQLAQMGALTAAGGILLGSFTELEALEGPDAPLKLLQGILADKQIPLATTSEVGHGPAAKMLKIGGEITLRRP